MSKAIEQYLDQVLSFANRSATDAEAIRRELKDHLATKVEELKAASVPPEDAVFEAIKEHGNPRIVGYGLRPRFPLIDVRTHGTARGVIAIGPRAIGIFASGGMAIGIFAVGGLSIGVFGMGGFALSLLFCWGGIAVAPLGLAFGGIACGAMALGGFALGIIATGQYAIGVWVPGASQGIATHAIGSVPTPFVGLFTAMRSSSLQLFLSLIFVALFMPILAGSQFLMFREKRRVGELA